MLQIHSYISQAFKEKVMLILVFLLTPFDIFLCAFFFKFGCVTNVLNTFLYFTRSKQDQLYSVQKFYKPKTLLTYFRRKLFYGYLWSVEKLDWTKIGLLFVTFRRDLHYCCWRWPIFVWHSFLRLSQHWFSTSGWARSYDEDPRRKTWQLVIKAIKAILRQCQTHKKDQKRFFSSGCWLAAIAAVG